MVIHASWFTELALRFAIGVSKHFDVVIVLDRDNFDRDCRGYIDVPPEVRCVLLPGLVRWRNLIRYISLLLRYRPDVIQLEEDVGHKHKLRGFMLASRWFAPTVWRVHPPPPPPGRRGGHGGPPPLLRGPHPPRAGTTPPTRIGPGRKIRPPGPSGCAPTPAATRTCSSHTDLSAAGSWKHSLPRRFSNRCTGSSTFHCNTARLPAISL